MNAEIQYGTMLLRFTPQLLYLQYLLPSASSAAGKLKPPLSPDFDLTQGEDYLIIHQVLISVVTASLRLQSHFSTTRDLRLPTLSLSESKKQCLPTISHAISVAHLFPVVDTRHRSNPTGQDRGTVGIRTRSV